MASRYWENSTHIPMSETGHLRGFLLCSHNCDFPMVMVLLQNIEIWLNFPEADDCMFIFVVECSKAFGTISKSLRRGWCIAGLSHDGCSRSTSCKGSFQPAFKSRIALVMSLFIILMFCQCNVVPEGCHHHQNANCQLLDLGLEMPLEHLPKIVDCWWLFPNRVQIGMLHSQVEKSLKQIGRKIECWEV